MTESALKVEIENLSEVKRKLKIEVPSTEVTQEVDRAYRELGKRAKVKGFRPGKVPRSILEMYYRKEIDHDVSETLVRRSLGEALKDKGLEAINLSWPEPAPPVVAGEDYCYSVELEVSPEFTAEDYLGLKLEAPEVAVTDAEVEARLEEIRQANALLKPPAEDRGVQEGDFVVLDHQAHFAGQPVEGGKSEGAYLEVGSGQFNAEFEGNLVGLKAGAEARFPVSLPDDFANPLIAGKVIDFAVKVQEVKEKVVPELDDTFARNLGGNFQTLADLRTAVREDIIKTKERERQAYLENQVADRLLARHQFEAPPSLITQEQENMLRDQMDRFRQRGMNTAGMDTAKMLEVMKPMAERRVRVRLVLSRIADQENLAVDEAEMDAALARIAVNNRRDVAEIRKFYEEHDLLGALRRTLLDDKTMKLLLDKAEINAPPAQVNIGSTKFENVPIPIAFEDRYFLVEQSDHGHIFTVVTVSDDIPVVEVVRNEPKENPLTKVVKNPTGIITVSDPTTGSFLYKIRPGSESSTIFGRIRGEEQEMQISDRQIKIGTNVIERCEILNFPVGIMVNKDGSFAIGAQLPLAIQTWLRETTAPEANE